MVEIVDSAEVIVAGQAVVFTLTVTKDGATYNLTGKTLYATIRAKSRPNDVVHTDLEDHAVALVTAASGIVSVTLNATKTAYLAPSTARPATYEEPYLLQLRVAGDDYFPEALEFGVRRAIN